MNANQTSAIESFKARATSQRALEVKMERVSDLGYGKFFVVLETGYTNDEGTNLELLCRDHWNLIVGPRGGLKAVSSPNWTKGLRSVFGAKLARHA